MHYSRPRVAGPSWGCLQKRRRSGEEITSPQWPPSCTTKPVPSTGPGAPRGPRCRDRSPRKSGLAELFCAFFKASCNAPSLFVGVLTECYLRVQAEHGTNRGPSLGCRTNTASHRAQGRSQSNVRTANDIDWGYCSMVALCRHASLGAAVA